MSKVKILPKPNRVTRDITRGQKIIKAHGDKIPVFIVTKFQDAFYQSMTTKLVDTIERINNDVANISNIPKGLLSDVYLLSAYLYYEKNQTPLTDEMFDLIARRLLKIGYDKPITKSDLQAGTYIGKYPNFIQTIGSNIKVKEH